MEWGGRNERQWQEAYAAAKRYFAQHGDLNVPYDYVTPEGFRLGQWIVRQRMACKGHAGKTLSPERKQLLETIGMDWREEDPWQKHFEEVCAYQKEYGHLMIPASYKTADGCWLNRWFASQRKKLRETPEKLTPEQRQKLFGLLGGGSAGEETGRLHAG